MRAYTRFAWRLASSGPGPWLIAGSGIGWLLLLRRAMAMPHEMTLGPHAVHRVADWALMLLAMSPLVLRNEIEWLHRNSLRCRRAAALALFSLGYAAPWLLVGWARFALPAATTAMVPVAPVLAAGFRQRTDRRRDRFRRSREPGRLQLARPREQLSDKAGRGGARYRHRRYALEQGTAVELLGSIPAQPPLRLHGRHEHGNAHRHRMRAAYPAILPQDSKTRGAKRGATQGDAHQRHTRAHRRERDR